MDLKVVKSAVTSRVGRQLLITQKHSPRILFVGGAVGVAATVVMACRATLKLEEILDESRESHDTARNLQHSRYSEQDRKRDHAYIGVRTALKITKLYAPSVALGTVSVCALTGSHVILSRRNVALTAAYSALDKGFREYRARVVDELGSDKDREFRFGKFESREEIVLEGDELEKRKVLQPGAGAGNSIYARFFDESCTSWSKEPMYNQFFVQCQQAYANDLLRSRGHLFLNEVYDVLGIPRTKEGAVVGWLRDGDGDGFVDFGIFDGNVWSSSRFVKGQERSILLDFNVDGVIFDKI